MTALPPPAIAVHGGAGALDDPGTSGLGPGAPRAEGVGRAAAAAWELLRAGGSALDAVVLAESILEDDPTFNAGTGATLTRDGHVELDASVMDGASLAAGAVACLRDVRNPIQVARAVMERSGHLLLVGEGASGFAREAGFPPWPNERLVTPHQRARFDAARGVMPPPVGGGTIGAVARDASVSIAGSGDVAVRLAGGTLDARIAGSGDVTWSGDGKVGAVSTAGSGRVAPRG